MGDRGRTGAGSGQANLSGPPTGRIHPPRDACQSGLRLPVPPDTGLRTNSLAIPQITRKIPPEPTPRGRPVSLPIPT